MKNPLALAFTLGLASCAAPKAVVVAEAPAKPKQNTVAATQGTPAAPGPEDGLRPPSDMLALPDDSQLRSSVDPSAGGDATVITRPPAE